MNTTLTKEKLLNLNDCITPMSLVYLSKIGEHKGRQLLYSNQQQELLDKLQIETIVENTIASNAIDGLKIDYDSFMEIFEGYREPSDDNESEISRYVKVLNLIYSHFEMLEITPDIFLQFHRNLFRYKTGQGGKWKSLDNIIERQNDDGTSRVAFVPVSAEKTPDAIKEICSSYLSLINDPELVDLVVIAVFALDILCVHPFTVGNGRIARLITQLLLYQQNYQVAKYVSIDSIILKNKSKYLQNLNKASQGWYENTHNVSGWVEFFLWTILTAYESLDRQLFTIKNKRGAKGHQVRLVIDSLSGVFKVGDIVNKCPGISRPTINKILQELRDQNIIAPCSMGRDAVWKKVN